MSLPSSWTFERTLLATLLASTALASLLLATPARAQLLDQFLPADVYGVADEPDVTVISRRRTGYDNGGIRVGSYVIRPQISESVGYESNVLGQQRATGSSLVQTNASLGVGTDNSRGGAYVGASVSDTRYIDLPTQSYTNWAAQAGGNLRIGRDTLTVSVSHQNQNQTQRDLDTPRLAVPLTVAVDTVRVAYRANFNRLSVTPNVEAGRYLYNSGQVNGIIYDQSYRNRIVATPGVTAAYEFATRRSAVLVVRNTIGSYFRGTPSNPKRDFNDASILGGVDYDLNGSLRARVLAGYEVRTFTSNAYQTIQQPVAELTMIYNPSGLTTVTAVVARRIQDSADETTAGVTSLSGQLRVDHEFRRNILFGGSATAARNDYAAGGSQNLYAAGVSGTYLINRYASATASYEAIARTGSTALNLNGALAGSNFVDHRLLLQVRLGL